MTPAERRRAAMGRAWWNACEGAEVVSVADTSPGYVGETVSPFACCVVTEDGLLIHGVRVPDDYDGDGWHVYRGRSCTALEVDGKHGTPLTDFITGRELIVPAEDNKIRGALSRADTIRTVVRPARPPPPMPVRRR